MILASILWECLFKTSLQYNDVWSERSMVLPFGYSCGGGDSGRVSGWMWYDKARMSFGTEHVDGAVRCLEVEMVRLRARCTSI